MFNKLDVLNLKMLHFMLHSLMVSDINLQCLGRPSGDQAIHLFAFPHEDPAGCEIKNRCLVQPMFSRTCRLHVGSTSRASGPEMANNTAYIQLLYSHDRQFLAQDLKFPPLGFMFPWIHIGVSPSSL